MVKPIQVITVFIGLSVLGCGGSGSIDRSARTSSSTTSACTDSGTCRYFKDDGSVDHEESDPQCRAGKSTPTCGSHDQVGMCSRFASSSNLAAIYYYSANYSADEARRSCEDAGGSFSAR